MFTIEHFIPTVEAEKRGALYLKFDYNNLLYSCYVCNVIFKRGQWPTPMELLNDFFFLNPCEHDYDDHVFIDEMCKLQNKTNPGAYTIRHIALNRPSLITLRQARDSFDKIDEQAKGVIKFLRSLKPNLDKLKESSQGDEREQIEELVRDYRMLETEYGELSMVKIQDALDEHRLTVPPESEPPHYGSI